MSGDSRRRKGSIDPSTSLCLTDDKKNRRGSRRRRGQEIERERERERKREREEVRERERDRENLNLGKKQLSTK